MAPCQGLKSARVNRGLCSGARSAVVVQLRIDRSISCDDLIFRVFHYKLAIACSAPLILASIGI